MYVLIKNGKVSAYPYSVGQLRTDNPQTSFPKNPSIDVLATWGVYPVQQTSEPPVDHTKNVIESTPVQQGGEWVQAWNVTDATAEEIAQRTEDQANNVRAERNQKLSECDWTQLPDAPVSQSDWATYRQNLRNITAQTGFPWSVVWPTQP
jgi:hypothetical protein